MRYERHTDLDGIIQIEPVAESEVQDILFQRRSDKMEADALEEIAKAVEDARYDLGLIHKSKPNPMDILGSLQRHVQQQATQGFNWLGNPHVNGQAAQQVPRQYLGMLGGFPW